MSDGFFHIARNRYSFYILAGWFGWRRVMNGDPTGIDDFVVLMDGYGGCGCDGQARPARRARCKCSAVRKSSRSAVSTYRTRHHPFVIVSRTNSLDFSLRSNNNNATREILLAVVVVGTQFSIRVRARRECRRRNASKKTNILSSTSTTTLSLSEIKFCRKPSKHDHQSHSNNQGIFYIHKCNCESVKFKD